MSISGVSRAIVKSGGLNSVFLSVLDRAFYNSGLFIHQESMESPKFRLDQREFDFSLDSVATLSLDEKSVGTFG